MKEIALSQLVLTRDGYDKFAILPKDIVEFPDSHGAAHLPFITVIGIQGSSVMDEGYFFFFLISRIISLA